MMLVSQIPTKKKKKKKDLINYRIDYFKMFWKKLLKKYQIVLKNKQIYKG